MRGALPKAQWRSNFANVVRHLGVVLSPKSLNDIRGLQISNRERNELTPWNLVELSRFVLDGLVHRVIAESQRECFSPPLDVETSKGKQPPISPVRRLSTLRCSAVTALSRSLSERLAERRRRPRARFHGHVHQGAAAGTRRGRRLPK